jgi:hypothetical protein
MLEQEEEMARSVDASELMGKLALDLLPASRRSALEVLTRIDYPIHDLSELDEALSGIEGEPSKQAGARIRSELRPVDFPLVTPRGSVEKYFARIHHRLGGGHAFDPFDGPGLEPLDPRDEPDLTPDDPFFGTDACGRAAQRVYQETLQQFAFFPSARRGAYNEARDFVRRCRARIPEYSGSCAEAMSHRWADCYSRGLSYATCRALAALTGTVCRSFEGRVPPPDPRDPRDRI